MEILLQPWPWYIGGPAIALVLFLMNYFGKSFGVSTNLETFCTMAGAGKFSDYFNTNWKERKWSLLFVAGIVVGGFLASVYMMNGNGVELNPKTIEELSSLGFQNAGATFMPQELFSLEVFTSFKELMLLLVAGVFIGFGTRYASGCTSGHSITGLSSLQLPSLIATVGFFAGGLFIVWVIFPLIF